MVLFEYAEIKNVFASPNLARLWQQSIATRRILGTYLPHGSLKSEFHSFQFHLSVCDNLPF